MAPNHNVTEKSQHVSTPRLAARLCTCRLKGKKTCWIRGCARFKMHDSTICIIQRTNFAAFSVCFAKRLQRTCLWISDEGLCPRTAVHATLFSTLRFHSAPYDTLCLCSHREFPRQLHLWLRHVFTWLILCHIFHYVKSTAAVSLQ